jgi:hypothetical protein
LENLLEARFVCAIILRAGGVGMMSRKSDQSFTGIVPYPIKS